MEKPKIQEVIVVEGRYDKNALLQVVDASIFELGGFGIFNDREKTALLRRLAETRGIILFTDPDGAGFDASWTVSPHSGSYDETVDLAEWQASGLNAIFTVPNDAQTGDRFVLTLSVRTRADRPCTRYAQVAVAVA